jgi:ATP-binding protein involved in chromosome partitioning
VTKAAARHVVAVGSGKGVTFAAPLLGAALRQLVEQVSWRSLDVLLIDLPPGTADLQQQLFGVVALAGAVVVVGPQDVAHLDARKFVDFLQGAKVRVLGGVENMTADGVPLLGRIPLDPDLANQEHEFDHIAEGLVARLEAA